MVPPQEGQYHQGIALDGSYIIEWASARVPPTPPHWSRAFAAQAQAVAFFLGGGGRPYFLLAMAWGLSASIWRGRKLTLGRWNDGCKEALQHWRCTQGHPRVQELSIVGQYCSDQQPSLQESQVHRKARTSPVQSSHLILLPHSCTPTMHFSPRL